MKHKGDSLGRTGTAEDKGRGVIFGCRALGRTLATIKVRSSNSIVQKANQLKPHGAI